MSTAEKSYGKKDAATDLKNTHSVASTQLTKAKRPVSNNFSNSRDPRSRLLSDSSDEVPRGILKNARVPTKRSASECVDDLSQIMADLNLNIEDLSKAKNNGKFCPYHSSYFFDENDELVAIGKRSDDEDDYDDEDEYENDYDDEEEDEDDYVDNNRNDGDDDETDKGSESSSTDELKRANKTNKLNNKVDNKNRDLRKCDCLKQNYRDEEKPTKSVRFDERVYELKIASRLFDRRAFTKYRLSSRHHPVSNQTNSNSGNKKSKNKKKRNRNNQNKSNDNNNDSTQSVNGGNKSETNQNSSAKKQTKSQRAKQSKKAKKKLQSMKRDEHSSSTDTSSDDQGYCSSLHCLSD